MRSQKPPTDSPREAHVGEAPQTSTGGIPAVISESSSGDRAAALMRLQLWL